MAETPLLESLESPADLRLLKADQLPALAAEIREYLTEVVSCTGGHLASNLGVVELSIALHRVFDFSRDRLVFDVGHQCYVHKLLTGRLPAFPTLRQKGGLTGFPCPRESEYDLFTTGHACTSISAALGLALAARLRGEKRRSVALIGDGAIGGGMAFEALNHAGHSGADLLVVLNDNDMAIAETVGALSSYLTRIRTEPAYQHLREDIRQILNRIPVIGGQLDWLHEAVLDGIKQVVEPGHVFTDLGFAYYGPIDGHDLDLLTRELENLRALGGPRLLHVTTRKGNGFAAAQEDPERFHSAVPFEILPGGGAARKGGGGARKGGGGRNYTAAFADALGVACGRNERLVPITAAMPAGTGLSALAERYPDRYLDVGISEEHAVTLAGGLARGGCRPVVVIYSTFLQRSYDQIFHDVCLQGELPVVFALDRAGLVGADGPTHHGVYDIAMLRHLPNLTLLAPADEPELRAMLDFALAQPGPVALRYPRSALPEPAALQPEAIEAGRSVTLREGADGVVFAYGAMVRPALDAAAAAAEAGTELTVVNLRFAKPLDEERILALAAASPAVLTVEDGCLAGGVGSAVAELLADAGVGPGRLVRLGVPDRFVPHGGRDELLADLGLDVEGLRRSFLAAAGGEVEGEAPS
jgi:1-deoxy-D-xylulose-5-phosphate synthase